MVQVLLAYGADVYKSTSAFRSPLQTAVVRSQAEIFRLLLERGEADPFTDTGMEHVMAAIDRLPSRRWVYMRILQLCAVDDVDANDFTDSGPYATHPSEARRDRDELFKHVLSDSTIHDDFYRDLVSVAVRELGVCTKSMATLTW